MAKSKSPKAKSFSATIGFEQQIWDAACELQITVKSLQDLSSKNTSQPHLKI
ncbi:MAG: hypothetical protein SO238_00530 [Treponema sp.]|nr:hypothetical protein [Treponema sp.]